MITQKHLKTIFNYNPETGIFTRLIRTSNAINAGDTAGFIDKNNGYCRISVENKSYFAHRLAWFYVYGIWPVEIDHINHDRSDNRLSNIRAVDRQTNMKNITIRKANKYGITGISWIESESLWHSFIQHNKRTKYLGKYKCKFEAICARKSAENKYGYHANHGT